MSGTQDNGLKLHIGGTEPHAGWSILNILPGPHVDYVGNCNNLSFLADGSCIEVYASHVLEHLSYDGELQAALREFHRVLAPDGRLRISVPDLEILCKLFLHPKLTQNDRYNVMRMIFGGQVDAYDFHKCGLTHEFLSAFIFGAGFQTVLRVEEFGEFKDSSQRRFAGNLISLNMEAYK